MNSIEIEDRSHVHDFRDQYAQGFGAPCVKIGKRCICGEWWRDFIVRSESVSGLLPEQVAEHVRDEYLAEYPGCVVVVDAGGMGKIHAETMRRRYALPIRAAEKREKPDAIRDFRGRLLSGVIQVLEGAQNDAIRGCYSKLGWDKKREQHSPDQESALGEALDEEYRAALRSYMRTIRAAGGPS